MLQTYQTQSVRGEHDNVSSVAQMSSAELLAVVFGFIRRRFLTVLAVVPLPIGLAAVYLLTTTPLYEGTAKIILNTGNKLQVFQQPTIVDPGNAAVIDSEIEVLQSDNFALSIIKNLRLNDDPEFVSSSLGGGGLLSHLFGLVRPYVFGPAPPRSESEITQGIVSAFPQRLTVARVGMTYVIAIQFKSTNPNRAAELANAVADGFVVDRLEARYQTLRTATAWMQDRMNELRSQVSAADRAVIDYKAANNIVDTKGGGPINDQNITALNAVLIKARADVVEAKARLDRLTQILDSSNLNPADTKIGAVTDSLHNEIINKLRTQYLDLAQREAIFSVRYGHDHLAVVNIRTQMAGISHSIVDELKQIAAAYGSDYDIAKARQSSLEKSLAASVTGSQTTSKAAIELRQLESAAQTYHALYDTFQQHYTEAVQQQSLPENNARIITRATPPEGRYSPKVLRTLEIAAFGGLALGFGLALLQEISDRVFRTARQVEAQLRTECMALIPLIKPNAGASSPSIKPHLDVGTSRIIRQNDGLFRYVIDSPLSRFAESIRAVKVAIDLGNVAKSNKVIGITSSMPNEGKSLISASLAQLCTPGGARVILIDCDLRLPSLSPKLAPKATKGLIDVLTGSSDVDSVIWTDPSTNLSFLPVVAKSRLTHTGEILASDAMKQLLQRLRARYDYVIVDLSPLAPVIDARATTRLVDSYLFVIEWGKTKIGVVEHALSAANEVYENLLGVVLNKVDIKLLSRYDSDRGEYYYNPLYTRYGYTDS